ncbi:MAG: sensor histidine kinase [Chlorobium sp.]|nr:sensor histidine kinase [Chlorobium sp.]
MKQTFLPISISAYFKSLSIRRKILAIVLPVALIPLAALAFITNRIAVSAAIQQSVENSNEKLLQISRQVTLMAKDVDRSLIILSTSKDFQITLRNIVEKDTLSDIEFRARLSPIIHGIITIGANIENCRVVSFQGREYDARLDAVFWDENFLASQSYRFAINNSGRISWQDLSKLSDKVAESGNSTVLVSKAIIDIDSGKYLGMISFEINEVAFSSIFRNSKIESFEDIFIANRKGFITSARNKTLLGESIGGASYFMSASSEDSTDSIGYLKEHKGSMTSQKLEYPENLDWILFSFVPIADLNQAGTKISYLILLIGLGLFFVAAAGSVVLSRSISRPILKLVALSRAVSEGDLEAEIKWDSSDEIGMLADHFNHMIRSVRDLILQNYIENQKKRKLELSLLQSQINPHFLYNTIENIRYLSLQDDRKAVFEVATALGSFYKGVLSDGKDLISIEQEIVITSNYLKIQLIRFENLFDFEIQIDDSITRCIIPKLTLQPIVENSIVHGFAGIDRHGTILITGETHAGKLTIVVLDNGKGIPDNAIDGLISRSSVEKRSSGFGLHNIDDRIKMQFGNEYGLSIVSSIGTGTKVVVTLPYSPSMSPIA